jgi:2,4-diaminopentanoate dehydrogenase
MNKLRVIQWTTGKVGKLSLRAILDDPRLELAGVYAYSSTKSGTDAGKLCGRGDCGVRATDDVDALIALKADTVIYTPFMADVSHVVRLLESGLDVISTNLFLNVGGVQGDVKAQLEAACRRGDSSLYISGINPGWVNAMIAGMTAVCRRVEMVSITEAADCSVYESAETWLAMGMSVPKATPEVIESAQNWLKSFRDAVLRIADALEFKLDDIEFFIEYATASQRVDLGWFCMEKDTNAAVRGGWNGKINGSTVVQIKVIWYLTKHLNEGWPLDADQYHLSVKGEPNVDSRIRFTPPEHWGNHNWDTMTAMPAVNAVLDVKAARSGILGLRDVGLPHAPAGLWKGK